MGLQRSARTRKKSSATLERQLLLHTNLGRVERIASELSDVRRAAKGHIAKQIENV